MDFNWALEQMKKGKKVGRVDCVSYIQLLDDKVVDEDGNQVPMLLETLQSKDWFLFEEPKVTLSEKIHFMGGTDKPIFEFSDVEEFIANIRDRVNDYCDESGVQLVTKDVLIKIIEEEAGPRFK